MPRHLIKRYTPDYDQMRKNRHLRVFGGLIHDPNLWHLNRRSVSGAFAAGLFWAVIPIPLQMLAAAATAIVFRVNLPISVTLVWLTNPFTIPAVFYCCYLVGNLLLGRPPTEREFEFTLAWISTSMGQIWEPLLLGSLVVGMVLAIVGFVGMRTFWQMRVLQKYRNRHPRNGTKPPSCN